MARRSALIGTWVLLVALLGAAVAARAPRPNTERFGWRYVPSVSVQGPNPAGVAATLLSTEATDAAGVYAGAYPLLLTTRDSTPIGPVAIEGTSLSGGATVVDDDRPLNGQIALSPRRPRLLAVELGPPLAIDPQTGASLATEEPEDGDVLDAVVAEGPDVQVVVKLRVEPVTYADAGFARPVAMPEERLPRPAEGTVLAERLADGTPVMVVGAPEGPLVMAARSPHGASTLVGWCPGGQFFTDEPGSSRFTYRGEVLFGPAPHGLTPYAVRVEPDAVVVVGTGVPGPRASASDLEPHALLDPDATLDPEACSPYDFDEATGTYTPDLPPGWVEHDLADWPVDRGRASRVGWFRRPAVAPYTGLELVRKAAGQAVDVTQTVSERGSVDYMPTTPRTLRGLLVGVGGPGEEVDGLPFDHGSVVVRQVALLDPAGVHPLPSDGVVPPGSRLIPTFPGGSTGVHPLAADLARPIPVVGALVEVDLVDGVVTAVRRL